MRSGITVLKKEDKAGVSADTKMRFAIRDKVEDQDSRKIALFAIDYRGLYGQRYLVCQKRKRIGIVYSQDFPWWLLFL